MCTVVGESLSAGLKDARSFERLRIQIQTALGHGLSLNDEIMGLILFYEYRHIPLRDDTDGR